jgi:hypothetical protein
MTLSPKTKKFGRNSQNICRLPPSASNTAKIAQFSKRMGEDRVFWCKVVLVFGDE